MNIKISLLLLSLLISPKILLSQSIVGHVYNMDSLGVSFSIVSLLNPKDSSVVSYDTSDKDGAYYLESSTGGNYLIRSTHTSYEIRYDNVVLKDDKTVKLDLFLDERVSMLEEVVIGGNGGVKYVDDTIRYNAKLFADGSEEVLGDLLDKLPGIEVDSKGGVKAQGKDVAKILLDGRNYFEGSPQFATKNLSADIAETVEVLSNYSEYSILDGFQSSDQTVINIGVDKGKYGKVTGDLLVGGGYDSRYRSNANLLKLQSKSMFSFIGALNNTGEVVFSSDDYFRLMGGVGNVIGKGGKLELSEEVQRLLSPQNNTFSKVNGLSALNFLYNPNSKLKINSFALLNSDKTESEDHNRYDYFIGEEESFTTSEEIETNRNTDIVSGRLKLEYLPSKNLSLIYKGTASKSTLSENSETDNIFDDSSSYTEEAKRVKPLKSDNELLLMNSFGNNVMLTNAKVSYNSSSSNFTFKTDSLLLPLGFDQNGGYYYGGQNKNSDILTAELSSSLFYRINNNLFIQPQIGVNFDSQNLETKIYNEKEEEVNPDSDLLLDNDQNIKNYDLFSSLSLVKNRGVIRFKIGVGFHYLYHQGADVGNINKTNSFQLTPLSELTLVFSPKHKLSTRISKLISTNNIDYLTNSISLDSYRSYRSKSLVDQFYNYKHKVDLNYNFYDSFSDITLILSGVYENGYDEISTDYSQDGITSNLQYRISPMTQNIWSNIYLLKGLGYTPWKLALNGNFSKRKYYNYLSGDENMIISNKTIGKIRLKSNYDSSFNTELSAELESVYSDASITQDVRSEQQRYGAKLKYKANEKLYVESELKYLRSKMPSYTQDLWELNGLINYELSSKILLQLKGINMLNMQDLDWSSVSYDDNYQVERTYRKIPGNILLSSKWQI